jgi:hypothetical protein
MAELGTLRQWAALPSGAEEAAQGIVEKSKR